MSAPVSKEAIQEINSIEEMAVKTADQYLVGDARKQFEENQDQSRAFTNWVEERLTATKGNLSPSDLSEYSEREAKLIQSRQDLRPALEVAISVAQAKKFADLKAAIGDDPSVDLNRYEEMLKGRSPQANGILSAKTYMADALLHAPEIKSFNASKNRGEKLRRSHTGEAVSVKAGGRDISGKVIAGSDHLLKDVTAADILSATKAATPIGWNTTVTPNINQLNPFGTGYDANPRNWGTRRPYLAALLRTIATPYCDIAWIEDVITPATSLPYTGAATVVAEGALKPSIAWNYLVRRADMKKLAVWVALTEEILRCSPVDIESEARQRLALAIAIAEEELLFAGNGTYTGLNSAVGLNNYVRVGSDNNADALFRASGVIGRATWHAAMPDMVIMNSKTMEGLRLAKTTFGSYIFGNLCGDMCNTIAGMNIVISEMVADGEAWVGDFQTGMAIYRQSELIFRMFTSEDDEVRNIVRLLMEEFLMPVIFAGNYFAKVTGLFTVPAP